MTLFLQRKHRYSERGSRATDLRPSVVSGMVGEAMLTCDLGYSTWKSMGNSLTCLCCPLRVAYTEGPPLLPLEK